MKKLLLNLFVIIILSIFVGGILSYGYKYVEINPSSSVSPLPDFLTLSKNNQVRLLDLWSPIVAQTEGAGFSAESLSAKSVIVYDLTTNKTIFEKNTSARLPMASLTKIMTAIISLENKKQDDKYLVEEKDLVGEDSMGLSNGEVVSFDELIHGLMLPSGNDAAEVFANNFPTGRDGFIKAMNDKASALGLANTHFDNPSGLQGDGVQYTTVYDLVVITKYALSNFTEFEKVVSTPEYSIPQTPTHKAYDLYNETNLLTTYPGVKGVKTGFTPEAGLCLVTYLDYKGHRLIGVILNSENRKLEMKELLDNSLNRIGITPPVYKG